MADMDDMQELQRRCGTCIHFERFCDGGGTTAIGYCRSEATKTLVLPIGFVREMAPPCPCYEKSGRL
jgi:hypothetical protein